MASTDASAFPIKNKALRITFPLFDNDGDLVTGAAGLDSEVSKDGGSFTDCTNEATEIGASGIYYLDLVQAEMNADTVAIIVKTSTTDAKTTPMIFYPVEIKEPSAIPGFSNGMGLEEILAWMLAMNRNKMTQTSTTTTLRNDADSGNIGTSTVSDNGTTFTKGEWT